MYDKDDGSIDYAELADELAGMLHGYPHGDPSATLGLVADVLKADPWARAGRAMTAAAWVGRWYVKWQVADAALVTALIEGAARAHEVFAEAGCADPGGHEHPAVPETGEPEEHAALVALIGGPRAPSADGPPLGAATAGEAYACPAFLASLAAATVRDLQDALRERFEAPDTSGEDARYLTGDGRADLDALLTDIGRQRYSRIDPAAERAALWAARRLLAGARPEEAAPLALAVCHLAQHTYWGSAAPGVVAVYRRGLREFDLGALDAPCPHPAGHRAVRVRDTPRHARALLSTTAVDDPHGERCPRRVAERVRDMLDYTAARAPGDG